MRRSSADTKAVILAAARERFAADGYEKATIRSIAGDAGIDPAMVMRYFGNKEKLFAAAAQIDLKFPDFAAGPRDQIGVALVSHFLDLWEHNEGLQVLLRTGVTNEAAAERMRSVFATQLAPAIATLSGPQEAPARAGLAAAQILGLALARYILKFPPIVAMSREDVIDWVAPTVQRYICE
ncbi:TetR/AcrR family transcriptional regulator [Nonomuraea typhae]|uniref:TetR/AcrR family transcriptional regulator n=1 Tax=Nonomuraea typhae TaxID=2603600 RepID=UPI0012F7E66C|nr:TetR family transcriptional regulator [Nonomuraea typhae]